MPEAGRRCGLAGRPVVGRADVTADPDGGRRDFVGVAVAGTDTPAVTLAAEDWEPVTAGTVVAVVDTGAVAAGTDGVDVAVVFDLFRFF